MASTNSNSSDLGSNGLGQVGLNQRLSSVKNQARRLWIQSHTHSTQTNHLSFSERNHSAWLGPHGLADDHAPPSQLSLSNESICDSADHILKESNGVKAKLLRALSSSGTDGNTDDGKNKATEMLHDQPLLASAIPPPSRNNEISIDSVMTGGASGDMWMRGMIDEEISQFPLNDINANHDHLPFLRHISSYSNQDLISSNPIQYPLPSKPLPDQTAIFTANPSEGNFLHHNRNNNPITAAANQVNNVVSDDDDDEGDGRIHSLPCNKYGPYTCPKCYQVFPISQSFAAHVGGSHYKYESKAQRKKRLRSKIRNKNLRPQITNDGLTLVPGYSSQAEAVVNTNTGFAHVRAPTVKVEVDQVAPPPGMEARAHANDVKIKLEPDV